MIAMLRPNRHADPRRPQRAGRNDIEMQVRFLVPFIDRQKRAVVYSNLKDDTLCIRDGEVIPMPRMTGAQYEKKVREYLKAHLDNVVIQRLRANRPLTEKNLQELQAMLVQSVRKRVRPCYQTSSSPVRPPL